MVRRRNADAAICALMSTRTFGVAEDAAKEVYGLRANVQAIFFRPSPPTEKATARQDQAGQSGDRRWDREH